MKPITRIRPFARLLILAMLITPGWVTAQMQFTRIVVFGTSISDPGNAFALLADPDYPGLTRPANTPPYDTLDEFLIPDAPYAKGGHHFSNGATWIEQYAQSVGRAGDVRPAFRGNARHAANYAVGGARARNVPDRINLAQQVGAFLTDSGGQAPADVLYVVEMGSNDIRDALTAALNGQDPNAVISAALSALGDQIQILYGSGARKFLIANVPNLGVLPAVRAFGSAAAAAATQLTATFNVLVENQVVSALEDLPGAEVARLDVFDKITQLYAQPAAFGFRDAEHPCVTPNDPPFTCQEPDVFLFWDGIHPTRAGYAIFAQDAAAALMAAP